MFSRCRLSPAQRPVWLVLLVVTLVHAWALRAVWVSDFAQPQPGVGHGVVPVEWAPPDAESAAVQPASPRTSTRRPSHRVPAPPPQADSAATLADSAIDQPPAEHDAPSPSPGEDMAQQAMASTLGQPESSEPQLTVPSTATLPSSTVRLTYTVSGSAKGFHFSANATLLWQPHGQRYTARTEMTAFLLGTRSQTSTGTLGPAGLRPERFVDKARQERAITFDRTQNLVRLEGTELTAPMPEQVQDKLSVMLQMSALLAALPNPPQPGDSWTLPVAGSPGVENWVFRYEGSETLALPAGPLPTWRLQRSAERPNDPSTTLWFAPTLHHLPVRTLLEQNNGDRVDQQLSALP